MLMSTPCEHLACSRWRASSPCPALLSSCAPRPAPALAKAAPSPSPHPALTLCVQRLQATAQLQHEPLGDALRRGRGQPPQQRRQVGGAVLLNQVDGLALGAGPEGVGGGGQPPEACGFGKCAAL